MLLEQNKILIRHRNTEMVLLNPNEILSIIKAWGECSIYKQENYTCSPSIIHIVRLLQESII